MKKKLWAALLLAAAFTLTACSRENLSTDIPLTELEFTSYFASEKSVTEAKEPPETAKFSESVPTEITAEATAEASLTTKAKTEEAEIGTTVTELPVTTVYITEEPKREETEPDPYIYELAETAAETDGWVITETTDAPPPITDQPKTEIIGQYNQRSQTAAEIAFADRVFDLTNGEREKAGLPKLQKMDAITQMAATRAWEITITPTHQRPDGRESSSILNGMPYYAVGENLAAGQTTPEEVVKAWMDSEHHRENILSPDYEYLGVGYYNVEGTTYTNYWIQTFYS